MDLITYSPREAMPAAHLGSVRELFLASYHQYHYLRDLGDAARLRVVAVDHGELVGYASAKVRGGYAYLANLLVRADRRGAGVGRQLEQARYGWIRAEGLFAHVSCTCETGASQRLKIGLGLTPVAFKVGYRRGVVRAGDWGSAVVFSDARPLPTAPGHDRVDRGMADRVRYLAAEPTPLLDVVTTYDDQYVEIFTGALGAQALTGHTDIRFAGVDRDPVADAWHYCFQVCNRAYREGLENGPTVVRMPTLSDWPAPLEVAL